MKIDIIGDVHGCLNELRHLLKKLGYEQENGWAHPDHRKLAFIGDLTDRGPESLAVIDLVYSVWKHQGAFYVPGNHCNKLFRYFRGNKIQISHGLETTVAELKALSSKEREKVKNKFMNLYEQSPLYHVLEHGQLILAHAGIKKSMIGRMDRDVRTFVLYGDITGERLENGMPVRRNWAQHYDAQPLIVYGHTPVKEPIFLHNTVNIDTGSVFGGKLTALRYPEMNTIDVSSNMPYVEEKFRDEDYN
jgi:protein phosphatase